jgi:hypothetical protein
MASQHPSNSKMSKSAQQPHLMPPFHMHSSSPFINNQQANDQRPIPVAPHPKAPLKHQPAQPGQVSNSNGIRSGKWCTAHVKIAHLILQHQKQKHMHQQQQQHQKQQSGSLSNSANSKSGSKSSSHGTNDLHRLHNLALVGQNSTGSFKPTANPGGNPNTTTTAIASTFFPPIHSSLSPNSNGSNNGGLMPFAGLSHHLNHPSKG